MNWWQSRITETRIGYVLVKTEQLSNCKGSRDKKTDKVYAVVFYTSRYASMPNFSARARERERRTSLRISDRADNVMGMRSHGLIRIDFIGEIVNLNAVKQREVILQSLFDNSKITGNTTTDIGSRRPSLSPIKDEMEESQGIEIHSCRILWWWSC